MPNSALNWEREVVKGFCGCMCKEFGVEVVCSGNSPGERRRRIPRISVPDSQLFDHENDTAQLKGR
jgi:hypothetical protein